ncbi:hypothetical protein [Halarcobacter ebronensis]|uniref:Chemotaxis protein n=1 Tax=Halarcobacter ebronensis TaxID=1462615 RepID=A0A4Q1AWT5_9BACT|nr:hypothetical protein [Halarcobacter ebronensis]QKF82913.1 hypothetical protein AEBR_2446 [Halarcobacter ebronensis]RXK06929.1 hypothetical protein CRV07_05740 [Halarcobacter ebronensis]
MSMSQEEIESLMNGLEFKDDEASSEPEEEKAESQDNMSEDDINALIAQTGDLSKEEAKSAEEDESVDDILNSLENVEVSEESNDETNIDDIIKELEASGSNEEENKVVEEEKEPTIEETIAASNEQISTDNIDELLSSIDGITEEEEVKPKENKEESHKDDLDHKINSGVFPFPVEEDTKVVSQLSAVATDSEEKASKIFDVLSNILDYNNAIQKDIKALSNFSEKQINMLSSLNQKFPNIESFKQNLEFAKQMSEHISDANEKLNSGNTEIFQAMELMQYHDINRQKIERVMSVIRKLTIYLNNLFEDQEGRPEVAVARHIHGDSSTDDLMAGDDLEALIAEFNK